MITTAFKTLGASIDELFEHFATEVDEALADEMLGSINEDNRNLKPLKLAGMIRDMDADHWYRSGAPILIGRDGRLYDGQHRLEALRRAARARRARGDERVLRIKFLILHDVDEEARVVIDTNAPRTFADQAVIAQGVQYAKNIVPIGNRVFNWLEGGNPIPVPTKRLRPTENEFKAFYLQHIGDLNTAAYWGGHLYVRTRLPQVESGFAHFLITEAARAHCEATGVDVAQSFFAQLATGDGLSTGHPAKTLRETILRRREARTLTKNVGLALILRCWNSYAEQRQYFQATLPHANTVTNGNLALPVAPVANWTGGIFKTTHA